MTRRSLAPLLFGPLSLFLAVMVLVAGSVTHPPLLGWVGLSLLAAALLAEAAVLLTEVVRARLTTSELHRHAGEVHRLLVVLDTDIEPDELCLAVLLRALARSTEVRVVAPIMAPTRPRYAIAEEDARIEAEARLAAALLGLASLGIAARGEVGADDPLQAAGDVLASSSADEILLVAAMPSRRTWLDVHAERRLRDTFGVPVSTSFGRAVARGGPRQPGRPQRRHSALGGLLRVRGTRQPAPQRSPKEIS